MSIFCTNCGEELLEDSNFCGFCGAHLNDEGEGERSEQEKNRQAKDDLFGQFAAMHDLKGEQRDKFFKENMSGAALQVLTRIERNKTDELIEDAPELNEQKHGFIRYIGDSLYLAALAGYEMYLTSWKMEGKPLDKFKKEPVEADLVKEWLDELRNQYDEIVDAMSDEMQGILVRYSGFRMESIQEKHKEELESLSHAAFEKIEQAHTSSIIWGYFLGTAESVYRYKSAPKKS